MVRIRVGTGEAVEVFELHKGVLCFYSEYFRVALRDEWTEGKDNELALPTEDPATFRLFRDWLYLQKVVDATTNHYEAPHTIEVLCDLWAFGDRRGVPLLMNEAIDVIRNQVVKSTSAAIKNMPTIYANTMPGSKLRTFMVDLFTKHDSGVSFQAHYEARWTVESLLEVVRQLQLRALRKQGVGDQRREDVAKWDMCQYHVHNDGERCKK